MEKIMGFIIAFMLIFSSFAYAGGDKVCGEKGQGSTGTTGGGGTTQTQAAQ
jgi:hypothetical protein